VHRASSISLEIELAYLLSCKQTIMVKVTEVRLSRLRLKGSKRSTILVIRRTYFHSCDCTLFDHRANASCIRFPSQLALVSVVGFLSLI
jgi:hypothetical protein